MARLLLARHGNTFGPGDTPVWVGAREDLPLVEKGEAQAAELGIALRDARLRPARILSGPLKRTRRAAEIVADLTDFGGAIEIDERLREIDYGSWGGKTNEEIIDLFGQEALDYWNTAHRRPPNSDWSPDETTLKTNALSALADAPAQTGFTLLVTSNGVLRYVYGESEGLAADAKVKTGHVCVVERRNNTFHRLAWNDKPETGRLEDLLGQD